MQLYIFARSVKSSIITDYEVRLFQTAEWLMLFNNSVTYFFTYASIIMDMRFFLAFLYSPVCLTVSDVDECINTNPCSGSHELCINMPGTFSCVCSSGFRKSGNGLLCEGAYFCRLLIFALNDASMLLTRLEPGFTELVAPFLNKTPYKLRQSI